MKAATIVLVVLLSCVAARAETVTLAIGEWRPYVSESMPGGGFCAQIVTEALKAQGIDTHYVYLPWKRALLMAENAEVDGSFPWADTRERAEQFLVSDTIYSSENVLFYLKARFPKGLSVRSYADLKPYVIGGASSYWYEIPFAKAGLNVDYATSSEFSIKKLFKNRVDLVPEDFLVGWELVKKLFPGRIAEVGVTDTLRTTRFRLLASRQDPDAPSLIAKFNKGLAQIKADGTYETILDNYFWPEISSPGNEAPPQ